VSVFLLQDQKEKRLDKLEVGLDDRDNLVFPYYEHKGNLLGYKVHKRKTEPALPPQTGPVLELVL